MTDRNVQRYPRLPESAWWGLRKSLRQSVPGKVDALYIASKLNMSVVSAKSNVIGGLRSLGLIDAEGKPTELAFLWREDAHYKEACQTIIDRVYPSELTGAFGGESIDRSAVERWFAMKAGVGLSASQQMAALYALLAEGDPERQEQPSKRQAPSRTKKSKALAPVKPMDAMPVHMSNGQNHVAPANESAHSGETGLKGPSIHIDIQVHISPDASVEQIDKIFSSMALHLYQRKGE